MKEKIDCEYYDEELECCRKLSGWSQPMPVLRPCVESPCEYFKSISVNKQIDEMAQDMYNLLPDDDVNERDCRDAAKEMFAKDYRKQSVGEWVWDDDGYCRCSECKQKAPVTTQYQDEPMTTATKYCPNCGAMMKGGE